MCKKRLVEGARVRLFHPLTFGTMEHCKILEVVDATTARVRFDRPSPKGRHVFTVDTEHVLFPKRRQDTP